MDRARQVDRPHRFDLQGVEESQQVGAYCRLLSRAHGLLIHKFGLAITTQVRREASLSSRSQDPGDFIVGMNVIGEALEQYDGRAIASKKIELSAFARRPFC